MEWELKTEMIQLGNAMNRSESIEDKKKFHEFVLKHIKDFDNQAWSMFVEIVDFIPDELKPDIEFWKQVYPFSKKVDLDSSQLGLRPSMRIALLQVVCEKDLNITI